mgnify:FL=1
MERIRLGILGLGRAGYGMHLAELAGKEDKFEIYAVCDLVPERRRKVADEYGCRAYETFEDMLSDKDIDIFDIAVRSCDHYRYAKEALENGRNVLLEKPMAMNYREAEELVRIAEEKGVKLYIRHNRRFEGLFDQVRRIADSEIIGDVFKVVIRRNAFETRNDWQTLRKYGGGQLLNWGPHLIDQSLRFCGGDYTSLYSDLRQINASGDCEDHVNIIMKGVNNVTVDMEISCGCALEMPLYVVYGTRGCISANEKEVYIRYLDKDCEVVRLPANEGNPPQCFEPQLPLDWHEERRVAENVFLDQIFTAMYDDFRNGVTFPISHDEALKVMKVIEAVRH